MTADRNINKWWIIPLVIAVTAIVLCGCGKKDQENGAAEAVTEDRMESTAVNATAGEASKTQNNTVDQTGGGNQEDTGKPSSESIPTSGNDPVFSSKGIELPMADLTESEPDTVESQTTDQVSEDIENKKENAGQEKQKDQRINSSGQDEDSAGDQGMDSEGGEKQAETMQEESASRMEEGIELPMIPLD